MLIDRVAGGLLLFENVGNSFRREAVAVGVRRVRHFVIDVDVVERFAERVVDRFFIGANES